MFSFLYHCQDFYQTWLYIWVTQRVYYKKQEWLTLRDHLSSVQVFCGVHVVHLFSFLCYPIMCHYLQSSVLWCPLWFPHKNYVWFAFTSSCLQEGSCLIYVICVCLRIVVSNTYCVVFFFYYVSNFSGLSIFDCPFGLFIDYMQRTIILNLLFQQFLSYQMWCLHC
jgi:hypothetical protein